MNRLIQQRRMRGVTMTETLLSVFVMMASLAMASPWLVDAMTFFRAKNIAEQAQGFEQAAAQYYLSNSTAMLAAMADGTQASSFCVIKADTTTGTGGTVANDTALHTCAVDANWLVYQRLLSPSFKPTNAYNQRLVAVFRRIYDQSNQPTLNAEMVRVGAVEDASTISVPTYDELTTTAHITGDNGGVVPDKDRGDCKAVRSTSTYQACGTSGLWKVDLTKFISPAQLTIFANALPN